MRLTSLAGALALLCAGDAIAPRARAAAQDPPQTTTFRGGVTLVQWDVSVYDAARRPVPGLTADRFTLLEDGRPRPIMGFAEVRIEPPPPPTAAWMRDAAHDVTTNDIDDKRVFLLVVDDASFGGGLFWRRVSDRAREIAEAFFRRLSPGDLVAVIFTGDNRRSQDFTTDHARLRAAVERITSPAMPGPLLGLYATDTLRRATESLLAAPGRRKAIVDVTNFNMAMGAVTGADASQLVQVTMKMIEMAQRANVSVYMIRPEGDPPDEDWWENGFESGWFQRVPRETGGEALWARRDGSGIDEAVDRVFVATGSYYMLGFVSADPSKFHRITVSVDDPALDVRTRERFYPLKPDPPGTRPAPAPLVSSIAGILPNSSIRMRASAAPFATPGSGRATVAMTIGVEQVLTNDGRPPSFDGVQVLVGAFTAEGKARGFRSDDVRVSLRPGRDRTAEYEVLSTIALDPGRYALRVSAHSRTFDTGGSVYLDVEVPDFRKAAVSLSGVLVASASGPPVSPRDAFAAFTSVVPTALRTFARGQRVQATVRVYTNGDRLTEPVPVRIRLLDDRDRVVVDQAHAIAPERFGAARSIDMPFDLATAALTPGPYLLSFEARVKTTTARRDVRLVIR